MNYTIAKSDMVRFVQQSSTVSFGTYAKAQWFDSLKSAKEFAKKNNLTNVQFQREN